MSDDQDGCEWVFFLVPAYPGCPKPKAVKRLCVCVCVCVRARSRVRVCLPVYTFSDAEGCD